MDGHDAFSNETNMNMIVRKAGTTYLSATIHRDTQKAILRHVVRSF